MEIYCLKCKESKSIANPTKVVTKNGKFAVTSVCPDCNTKLFKFVKKGT